MDPHRPEPSARRGLWPQVLLVLIVAWTPFLLLPYTLPAGTDAEALGIELLFLGFEAVAIAILLALAWRRDRSFRRMGLRRCSWPRELLWAFALYCAAWMASILLDRILGALGWDPDPIPPPEVAYSRALLPFFLLVSAFHEELLFRGFLQDRVLRLTRQPSLAVVFPSVLFAVYHPYPLRSLVGIALFGVVFGLFQHAGRMLPRLVLAHAGFNLAIYFEWWRV